MIYAAEGWAARSELRELSPGMSSILEIDERLTVAGVVSRGGWPLENALVVLTDASGESVGATRTDDDGHYELGLPPLGRYVLTALDQDSGMAESQDAWSVHSGAASTSFYPNCQSPTRLRQRRGHSQAGLVKFGTGRSAGVPRHSRSRRHRY